MKSMLPAIMRTDLIDFAKAYPEQTKELQEFVAKMLELGPYTEATEDEIEELDILIDG